MPDLLSLPRELRDDIYRWLVRGSLALKSSRHRRFRISKASQPVSNGFVLPDDGDQTVAPNLGSETEYYEGEESIRYPGAQAIPSLEQVLSTNHQLRAEMNDTIQKNQVDYRIRLAFREDKELLYPTWLSMPAFKDHIDNLDVEIRIRPRKTASLFSTTSSVAACATGGERDGDVWFGGLSLLQRFLERGPSFLGKKKDLNSTSPITIGIMTLHIVPKDLTFYREPKEVFDNTAEWVNELLVDKDDDPWDEKEWMRVDDFLHFFAERINTFAIQVQELRREWISNDAIVVRDEKARRRQQSSGRHLTRPET